MAIAYLPSEGNIDKVSIYSDAIWQGESIGGSIISKTKLNVDSNNGNYYSYVYSNLGASSRWFYKDVTDYNFINGVTLYRCLYIGADDRYQESEILGTIASSVTHNGPSEVNGSVSVDLFAEGIYTEYSSKDSKVLYDEEDSTGLLNSATWSSSLISPNVLSSGQYLKVWVRIRFPQTSTLQNYTNYDYFIAIKDLTIPVYRTSGRLSLARVFTATLSPNSDEIRFEQSLPQSFAVDNIYKVIEHNNLTNIFYFDDDKFRLLIIQKSKDIEKNKYIDIDVTSILPDITAAPNNILSNFSICYSNVISGTDISAFGPSGTPSTTGTIDEYPQNSYDYATLINTNFLCDVFSSLKSSSNSFYLYYNKFLTDNTDEYVIQHGHRNFYWASYVLRLNLDFINDKFFVNIEPGIANTKYLTIPDQQNLVIKDRFYINSATQQDDLFTIIGYIPEDCRVTNNISKMIYLWEGDINRGEINSQECDIPKVNHASLHVIRNKCNTETYLTYDPLLVNESKFDYTRHVVTLDTGYETVAMGPPTQKMFDHGNSKVTYDIRENIDQFATTFAFIVNDNSVSTTTGTTGTSGTPSTSGNPSTSGTSASPCQFSHLDQNHMHLKLQSIYDSVSTPSSPVGCEVEEMNKIDAFKEIFRIHCNGNVDQVALYGGYNFKTKLWNVSITNEVGEIVTFQFNTNPLSTSLVNVITMNVFRHLDFGCAKKYILQYAINVNGTELINGIAYTHNTSDTYVISYNTRSEFAGYLTYWDVRDYISPHEAEEYAEAMYRIHGNLAWVELESETQNNSVNVYSNFAFKRNLIINNLNYDIDEPILFPIVLQGTGYNISHTYNKEVRRSVFDFSKIDINKKSFAFTLEGTNATLEWYAEPFNVDKDTLTIWIQLNQWNGQRISMYYSDMNLVPEVPYTKTFDNFYSVWLMNEVQIINQKRHIVQKIFASGESFVYAKEEDGRRTLVEINKQTPFGISQLYKSNKFNISWNDIQENVDNTNSINAFIGAEIKNIKPSYMEINEITSTLPYKMESENNHKHSNGTTSI